MIIKLTFVAKICSMGSRTISFLTAFEKVEQEFLFP